MRGMELSCDFTSRAYHLPADILTSFRFFFGRPLGGVQCFCIQISGTYRITVLLSIKYVI